MSVNVDNSQNKDKQHFENPSNNEPNLLINKINFSKKAEKINSILSDSSNENENLNEDKNTDNKNNNEQNNFPNKNKEIIDINEVQDDEFATKKKNNENEENISRSISSYRSRDSSNNKSFSRSRSRSRSNKNSSEDNKNNYYNNENTNNNSYGNKFKNYNNNRNNNRNYKSNNKNNNNFVMKNGCCRDCMKAFSKNGKSCLCQVPRKERKYQLPENGCNYCRCKGCNPIDVKYNERQAQKNLLFNDRGISHKNQRILDSDDENLKIKEDDVDYYNMEKKEIRADLNDTLKIDSIFYGFGVPLRTPTYILGYNPGINYFLEKKNNNNNTNNYFDYNNMNNNINNTNFMNNNLNNRNNNNFDFNNLNNKNKFKRNSFNNNSNNNDRNMNFNRNLRFRK